MFGALRKLFVCWILLSSLVSYGQTPSSGIATDKPKQQNTEPQKKPKTEQRGTEQSPFVVKVLPSQATEPPSAPPQKQEHHETTDWDWWLDKSPEIILAVATIGLWIATRNLVRGADNTSARQLRSYVGCERVAILDGPIRGEFLIKNFGQTMAKDVEVRLAGAIENVQPVNFRAGTPKCKTVLMPGEVARFDEEVPIGEDDVALLKEGVGSIFVFGRIDYKDVFDKPHWTTFRFVSDGWLAVDHTMGVPRPGWKAKTCNHGNDAD